MCGLNRSSAMSYLIISLKCWTKWFKSMLAIRALARARQSSKSTLVPRISLLQIRSYSFSIPM